METNDYSTLKNIIEKIRLRMTQLLEGFDGHLYEFEQDDLTKLPYVLIDNNGNVTKENVYKVCLNEQNELTFYIPKIGWISYKDCLDNSDGMVYFLMDKYIFG